VVPPAAAKTWQDSCRNTCRMPTAGASHGCGAATAVDPSEQALVPPCLQTEGAKAHRLWTLQRQRLQHHCRCTMHGIAQRLSQRQREVAAPALNTFCSIAAMPHGSGFTPPLPWNLSTSALPSNTVSTSRRQGRGTGCGGYKGDVCDITADAGYTHSAAIPAVAPERLHNFCLPSFCRRSAAAGYATCFRATAPAASPPPSLAAALAVIAAAAEATAAHLAARPCVQADATAATQWNRPPLWRRTCTLVQL